MRISDWSSDVCSSDLSWLEKIGLDVPQGSRLTGFLLVAIAVGVVFYLILERTRFGYDLRASGMNAWAAASSGVSSNAMVVKAMLLSGGIAGLVGMSYVLGDLDRKSTRLNSSH